jgi:hypothetical protein
VQVCIARARFSDRSAWEVDAASLASDGPPQSIGHAGIATSERVKQMDPAAWSQSVKRTRRQELAAQPLMSMARCPVWLADADTAVADGNCADAGDEAVGRPGSMSSNPGSIIRGFVSHRPRFETGG